MANPETDTDTLLALLASLLHPLEFRQSALLDVLARSQGDVEAAAALLRTESRSEPPKKKRKVLSQKSGLEGWLKSKSCNESHHAPGPEASTSQVTVDTGRTQHADPPASSPTKTIAKAKHVTNSEFMALLKPPLSSDKPKSQVAKLPPLTLTSPQLVSEHTPCTLHNSVLPPELACRCVECGIRAPQARVPDPSHFACADSSTPCFNSAEIGSKISGGYLIE